MKQFLTLIRQSNLPLGTFGSLYIKGTSFSCVTLELPWNRNKKGLSCIPAGKYTLKLRKSPIVERTSGGEFKEGYELTKVNGRSLIMIHPGNWISNTDGCILVGRNIGVVSGKVGITASRAAFFEVMKFLLKEGEEHEIEIKWQGNPELTLSLT